MKRDADAVGTKEEIKLEVENAYLRSLLEQAGADAVHQKAAEQVQRVLLEELHHRVKNTLATVQAITSQSLRTAETTKQASDAITSRLQALGRVHDILLRTSWGSTKLAEIIDTAIARSRPRVLANLHQSAPIWKLVQRRCFPLLWHSTNYARTRSNTVRSRHRKGKSG